MNNVYSRTLSRNCCYEIIKRLENYYELVIRKHNWFSNPPTGSGKTVMVTNVLKRLHDYMMMTYLENMYIFGHRQINFMNKAVRNLKNFN